MSKVAHYLQEHLLGEVTASAEVRKHFAHDASILRLAPAIVVYPKNESDVRKTARFAWQLAQRGKPVSITARGGGSDTSGAAIGNGILLVFTAHMNKLLALETSKGYVVTEPGITYEKLEQTLYTHGYFLPPYPSSQYLATIGGGLANNAIGEKTVKYGSMGLYAERLRVVLANGEIIETGPLKPRELNRKMGLSTFEGQIYRELDALLEESEELIARERARYKSVYTSVGFNLFDVKSKEGFNLTPLLVGSQGTLGVITEATLNIVPHNPLTQMSLASLMGLDELRDVLPKILELKPSVLDTVNREALALIAKVNPNLLAGALSEPKAAIHIFVEFDDQKDTVRKRKTKALRRIINKTSGLFKSSDKPEEQAVIWKLRQSVSAIITQSYGQAKAVPIAEDVSVPIANLADFLQQSGEIYKQSGLTPAAWGPAGIGVVRMQPLLDLAQLGDRQKLFKLSEAIYQLAITLGGSISASAGDGRVRAPYSHWQYGPELHELMQKAKAIFDPHNILNPGVKTASLNNVKNLMRSEYDLGHHHEHLPRS